MTREKKYCCICRRRLTGIGHNAEPFKRGECCDRCNNGIVLTMRALDAQTNNRQDSADAIPTDEINNNLTK